MRGQRFQQRVLARRKLDLLAADSDVRDPKQREAIVREFAPLKGSRIGELTARFDVVLGATPPA